VQIEQNPHPEVYPEEKVDDVEHARPLHFRSKRREGRIEAPSSIVLLSVLTAFQPKLMVSLKTRRLQGRTLFPYFVLIEQKSIVICACSTLWLENELCKGLAVEAETI
jgi:hypothetical protein